MLKPISSNFLVFCIFFSTIIPSPILVGANRQESQNGFSNNDRTTQLSSLGQVSTIDGQGNLHTIEASDTGLIYYEKRSGELYRQLEITPSSPQHTIQFNDGNKRMFIAVSASGTIWVSFTECLEQNDQVCIQQFATIQANTSPVKYNLVPLMKPSDVDLKIEGFLTHGDQVVAVMQDFSHAYAGERWLININTAHPTYQKLSIPQANVLVPNTNQTVALDSQGHVHSVGVKATDSSPCSLTAGLGPVCKQQEVYYAVHYSHTNQVSSTQLNIPTTTTFSNLLITANDTVAFVSVDKEVMLHIKHKDENTFHTPKLPLQNIAKVLLMAAPNTDRLFLVADDGFSLSLLDLSQVGYQTKTIIPPHISQYLKAEMNGVNKNFNNVHIEWLAAIVSLDSGKTFEPFVYWHAQLDVWINLFSGRANSDNLHLEKVTLMLPPPVPHLSGMFNAGPYLYYRGENINTNQPTMLKNIGINTLGVIHLTSPRSQYGYINQLSPNINPVINGPAISHHVYLPMIHRVSCDLLMRNYWHEDRQDHLSTATLDGFNDALYARYVRRINTYCVAQKPASGLIPIKLYYNDKTNDNALAATVTTEQKLLSQGYRFVRIEGYILPTRQLETIALNTYWNPQRQDYQTVAEGREGFLDEGYQFINTEGYSWVNLR